jgi:dienelactone hydrolase
MKTVILALGLILFSDFAAADEAGRDAFTLEILKKSSLVQSDLRFPKETSELGIFSNLNNAIFKPTGDGPFPAVVLSHTCGGIKMADVKPWVEEGLKQGYVVLVIDSMRGNKNNCFPPTPVPFVRRVKDMLDALEHLSGMSLVDSQRIGAIGYSQGSMVNASLSSKSAVETIKPGSRRFAAAVGLYGACNWPKGTNKAQPEFSFSYVMQDTDKPLLYMSGADDNETPASACETELPALAAKGVPVQWHLYEHTTHCWDCKSLNGFSKTDFKGDHIVYRFDKEVTDDSMRRAFQFLKDHM